MIAVALAVASCGFRPLYSGRTGGADGGELAQIRVQAIPDRVGQILYNHLLDRLNPRGQADVVKYTLDTQLRVQETKLALTQADVATRGNIETRAFFQLREIETQEIVFESSSRITNGYDIVQQQYAAQVAREAAVKRALREISDDMRFKLASFLTRNQP
ncbi:MAG: LPS assembly lipoprotein LptE [Alphaproteobacteria bacterium]|nr:LPS assembly lipoprotein LptE [Alphaproteobacteria bacterium]